MNLKEFVGMVVRRKRLILSIMALFVVATTVVSVLVPNTYEATATLFVSFRGTNDTTAFNPDIQPVQDERSDTYAELATSIPVLAAAAKVPGVNRTVDELESQLTVTHPPGSLLIWVTSKSGDPEQAAVAATAVAEHTAKRVEKLEGSRPGNTSRLGTSPVKVSLAEAAPVPTEPSSPKVAFNIIISFFAGLIFGLAAAVIREIFDRRVRSPEQVQELLDLPVLAGVDFEKKVKTNPLLLTQTELDRPEIAQEKLAEIWASSLLAEEYRQLRVNLKFFEFEDDRRSILVTSSKSGEGKTTTAGNLAITHALAGESVVLVDCDLRRPGLSRVLEIPEQKGLTDVLIGRAELDDALVKGRRMAVLPAGQIPPNPTELLGSQAMADLLGELHSRFDTVIIDTTPCLPFADATALAPLCGALLLVVRMDYTNVDEVERAYANLSATRARICGVVANMVTEGRNRGYGYYYGEGSGEATAETAASGFGDLVPRREQT